MLITFAGVGNVGFGTDWGTVLLAMAAAITGVAAATGSGVTGCARAGAAGSMVCRGAGAAAVLVVRRCVRAVRGFFFGDAVRSEGRSDAVAAGPGSALSCAVPVSDPAVSGVVSGAVGSVDVGSDAEVALSDWLVSEPPVPGSAQAGAGTAIALPIPKATASAPTRPT
ncbi:hypothetical protein H7J08_04440 [Mycobacterium frederiksbergense]|uniref:Uncharacterized protein n=1 Tax=Mycolicibacterium frederiksbergense TaxID=117567 RepID=A0A6H0SC92_9MYCO|nr:hypothetical protein [Mycolicibacterium frederiksbergense]MCV7043927.1 hypothetical protein [Mycolicibacterium frederiksbergense]QIV84059.1 hypothetical protein EXE63_26640 [Mycolicibacterium frederiksbergense]